VALGYPNPEGNMSDDNNNATVQQHPGQPGQIVLGEVLPEALAKLTGLKQQADQTVHQIGVHRVQEHRLMDQLRRLENATNQVVMEEGKRLGIPEGTAWSVTQDGKAVQVGAPPILRPVPNPPADNPEAPEAPEAG